MQHSLFLIGFVIMSLAPLAIQATAARGAATRTHTLLHATVPFVAATSYLAMALGVGTVLLPDGHLSYVARYLDWSLTTPLLLAGLVLTAVGDERRFAQLGGYLSAVLSLDVLMIVAGLISSLATSDAVKWAFYGWSCAAFVGVLYLLWVPLRTLAAERGDAIGHAYLANLSMLSVLWLLYPVVFLVGPEGVGSIGGGATVLAILVLDVLAKVAYAFVAAFNLDRALPKEA
ncbi:bacteriorhodopsin [Sphingomonas bacterium]|uniref:bacteriorhodopsin n=1 Tax=Sphingomonas bacterium TaxID=1895847 RepID=UPI0015758381|nr:bacteriorhodopsin [Sphingomonas bacterium]